MCLEADYDAGNHSGRSMINAVTKACSGPAGLEDDPGDSMKNHPWRSDGGQELRSASAEWAGGSQEVLGQRDSLLREQWAQSLAKTVPL